MKTISQDVFSSTLETKYVNSQLWEKIQQLNLTLIIERMIFKYRWSKKRTMKAVIAYRQFLYTAQVFEIPLSPTKDIDAIWHEHILHTNKYAADCKTLFGKFLHHFPIPAAWLKKTSSCDTDTCKLIKADCDPGGEECFDFKPKVRKDTTKLNFCGVDGDGEPEEISKPEKPKRTGERVKIDLDNPIRKGRISSVNFADVQQIFFLN